MNNVNVSPGANVEFPQDDQIDSEHISNGNNKSEDSTMAHETGVPMNKYLYLVEEEMDNSSFVATEASSGPDSIS